MKEQMKFLIEQNNKLVQKLSISATEPSRRHGTHESQLDKECLENLGHAVALVGIKRTTARPIALCYGKLEIIKKMQLQKITKEEIKKVCGLIKNIINLDEDRML